MRGVREVQVVDVHDGAVMGFYASPVGACKAIARAVSGTDSDEGWEKIMHVLAPDRVVDLDAEHGGWALSTREDLEEVGR